MSRQHLYHGHRLRIGRHSETGRVYMVTTVTQNRIPVFSAWDRGSACARVLHRMPALMPVQTLAWIVMPDHVHWMFALYGSTLGCVMKRFKACSAREVNKVAGETGTVWQAGYHDHAVRLDEDLRALARYVVANPVRAGLCQRVGDYPFWDAAWIQSGDASDTLD